MIFSLKDSLLQSLIQHKTKVAIATEGRQVLYSELDKYSNIVVDALQKAGVDENHHIGVYLSDPVEAIICFVAAIKLNVTFVPLDFIYPTKRIEYMVRAARVSLLITNKNIALLSPEIKILHYEELIKEATSKTDFSQPSAVNKNEDVYILFTSGSTGTPKAAVLYQEGIENLLQWYISEFNMDSSDRFLITSSLSFDLTQKNIWGALCVGAGIDIIPSQEFNPKKAVEIIGKNKITLMNCTPSIFYSIVDSCAEIDELSSFRYVLLGGEKINTQRLKCMLSLYPKTKIINTYGPTECSDITCFYTLRESDLANEIDPPVGTLVPHVKGFVLDDSLLPVLEGEIGRLYIGGVSVGGGYLNDKDLTNKKFLEITVNGKAEKVYDSGDLVKKLPDGNIQFINRADNQIKLRGLRIELDEIEKNILNLGDIKDVAVVPVTVGDVVELAAFIIAEEDEKISESKIYQKLADFLPGYMIPKYINVLPAFPLNSNGKVDRTQLKNNFRIESTERRNSALSNTEESLIKMVSQVLDRPAEKINVNNGFFELGGYSISAFNLLSHIYSKFGVEITFVELIQNQSIEKIAKFIEDKKNTIFSLVPYKVEEKYVPLSVAQKRIFNVCKKYNCGYRNLLSAIEITGNFDIDLFKSALLFLMKRHETLRMIVISEGDLAHQHVLPYSEDILNFDIFDLSMMSKIRQKEFIERQISENKKLDMISAKRPYFKIILFRISHHKCIVLFNFNHIIFDGNSWNLFKKELSDYYNSKGHISMVAVDYQYKEFTVFEQRKQSEAVKEKFKKFLLENDILKNSITYDKTPRDVNIYYGKNNSNLQNESKEIAKLYGVSQFSVLYVAFYAALKKLKYKDQNIRFILMNKLHSYFNDTMGIFIKSMPAKLLDMVHKDSASILQEANSYFNSLIEFHDYSVEQVTDQYSANIMFVFQNTDVNAFHFDGLSISDYEIKESISFQDLEFHIWPKASSLDVQIIYNPGVYPEQTIASLYQLFCEGITDIYQRMTCALETKRATQ